MSGQIQQSRESILNELAERQAQAAAKRRERAMSNPGRRANASARRKRFLNHGDSRRSYFRRWSGGGVERLEARMLLAVDLGDSFDTVAPFAESAGEGEAGMNVIRGQKYEDLNGNGTKDTNEPGLDGWTIVLLDANGNTVAQQTTRSIDLDGMNGIDPRTESGLYIFNSVMDGPITVVEIGNEDWMQTQPPRIAAGVVNTALPGAPATILPGYDLFTTQPGETTVMLDPDGPLGPTPVIPVPLRGVPLTDAQVPGTSGAGIDTIVRRFDGSGGPRVPGESFNVPIEIVALNLVSVQPITISNLQWNVEVQAGSQLGRPQPQGSMHITRTDFEGGVFDSQLPIQTFVTLRGVGHGGMLQMPIQETLTGTGVWSLQAGPGDPRIASQQLNTLYPSGGLHAGSMIDPNCPGHTVKVLTEEDGMLAAHGVLPAMKGVVIRDELDQQVLAMPAPGAYRFAVGGGMTLAGLNFGNVAKSSIHGIKFEDVNLSGDYDLGERPLEDVEITLSWTDAAGVAKSKTTRTMADGSYWFTGLSPHVTYTVTETLPRETFSTTPTNVTAAISSSGVHLVATTAQSAALQATGIPASKIQIQPTLAFGNGFLGSIHGFKFEDLNADGDRDPNEPPIAGVEIVLEWEGAGGVTQRRTTRTNTNGEYWFTGLRPGQTIYTLSETVPQGSFQTTVAPPPIILFESGQEWVATPAQAADVRRAATFDWSWQMRIDPMPMGNVDPPPETVTFNGTASVAFTQAFNPASGDLFSLTDSDGLPLPLPDGQWVVGTELLEMDLTGVDSMGNHLKIKLADVLISGYQPSMGGMNVRADAGSPFIAGDSFFDVFFDVTVTDVEGRSLGTIAPRDSSGNRLPLHLENTFDNDDMINRIDVRWPPVAFAAANLNLNLSPAATPSNPWDRLIALTTIPRVEQEKPARTIVQQDLAFGNAFEGSIHGFKFEDMNVNGLWDAGERPLPNVEIVLGWVDPYDGPQELRTRTDRNGEYWFSWLRPGFIYTVTEVAPQGSIQTTADPEPIYIGSGVEYVATAAQAAAVRRAVSFPWWWNITIDPVPLPNGFNPPPEQIMLQGMAMIGFTDPVNVQTNKATALVNRENGLPLPLPNGTFMIETEIVSMELIGTDSFGRTVVLTQNPDNASRGQVMAVGERNSPVLTGDSFFDVFFDITIIDPRSGPMTIRPADRQTGQPVPVEVGMTFTQEDQLRRTDARWMPTFFWQQGLGRDLLDDAGKLWDRLISIHAVPHVEMEKPVRPVIDPNLAFGNAFEGSIHGYKFEDINVNGVWDAGEPPLSGVEIRALGHDAAGNVVDVASTTTDARGEYWLTWLTPGLSYEVFETAPFGSVQTTDNPPRLFITSGKEWVSSPRQAIDVLNSVEFPWWLDVVINPNPATPATEQTFGVGGNVMLSFGTPVSLAPNAVAVNRTFDIVDQDGLPTEVPAEGGPWLIPFTLHKAEIGGDDNLARMTIRGAGQVVVQRDGNQLRTVTVGQGPTAIDSFFDVFFDLSVPSNDPMDTRPMRLTLEDQARPVRIPLQFPMPGMMPIGPRDVRWMPAIFWASGLGRDLLDDAGQFWDKLISIHAIPHVELEKPVRPMVEPRLVFGNAYEGSIHGYKFADRNGNGIDDGEPRLPGVTIQLAGYQQTAAGQTLVHQETAVTDANGEYWFTWLQPGLWYDVREVAPAGQTQSTANPPRLFVSSGKEWVATPAQARAVQNQIFVPWWWDVQIVPVGETDPVNLGFMGNATIEFGVPQSLNPATPNATFPLVDVETGLPLEVPAGGPWLIPFMLKESMLDAAGQQSMKLFGSGQIAVQRIRDQLVTLQPGDAAFRPSFFDIFVELNLRDPDTGEPMTVAPLDDENVVDTIRVPLDFPVGGLPNMDPIPAKDVRWMPTMLWRTGLGRELLDIRPPHMLWDRLISIHAIPHMETPKPIRPMIQPALAFGNSSFGSIHGYKFEDVNVNGIDDDVNNDGVGDEPRVGGVTINLQSVAADGSVVTVSTTTNAAGEYWFMNVSPGTYTVSEIPPWGSVATTPTVYTITVMGGEEYVALRGQAHLPANDPRVEIFVGPRLAFGNAFEGSIHGYKFDDLDVDGVWDAGEPGVEGVTIHAVGTNLINPTLQPDHRSTVTDRNGEYWFTRLNPGWTYTVHETVPFGAVQTTLDPTPLFISSGKEWVANTRQATDVLNAVEFPWWLQIQIQPTGGTQPVTLMPAGDATLAFGQPRSLSPNAADANATFDIVDAEGRPLEVPEQGGPWLVPFTLMPAEFRDEATGAVLRMEGSGRVVVRREGNELVTLPPVAGNLDSFFDIFVELELPMAGTDQRMRLTLDDPTRPMRIPLQFPMPGTMPITPRDIRWMPAIFWQMGLGRDLLDDAGALWDRLISIHAVPHGEPIRPVRPMVDPKLAIGNAYEGSIHGFKFEDLDGDGVRDPGEPPLAGVTMVLSTLDPLGNRIEVARERTDFRGEYWFTWLTPGRTYFVTEVAPAGSVQTTANPPPLFITSGKEWVATPRQGIDVLNSVEFPWWLQIEIQPTNSAVPQVLMPAGNVMLTFGAAQSLNPNQPSATFPIVDAENGLALEVPRDGGPWLVPFELHEAQLLDPATGAMLRIRGTGQVGLQRVRDQLVTLPPAQAASFFDIFVELDVPAGPNGDQRMSLSLNEPTRPLRIPLQFPMPGGMPINARDIRWMPAIFWATGLGRDLLDNAGTLWDKLISIHAVPHGEVNKPVRIMQQPALQFGNAFPGSIHGYKFEDLNVNGIDDDKNGDGRGDEPRLANVLVTLTGDVDGDGDADTLTERTNAAGEYWFVGLHPGLYTVTETPPAGSIATTPVSYVVEVHSRQELVAVADQAHLPAGDPRVEIVVGPRLAFGNAFEGSIHGFKFHDRNGNGVRDPNDPPLANVQIVLAGFDSAGNQVSTATTRTDANGEYWFSWLRPGLSYQVSEVAPAGFVQTTANPPRLFVGSGKEWVATQQQGLAVQNSVSFPWWLQIEIDPVMGGGLQTLMPMGMGMLNFAPPRSLNPLTPTATFNLVDPENGLPLEVPEQGGPWLIPFTLPLTELTDSGTETNHRLWGSGELAVERRGDQLVTLTQSDAGFRPSFFDIFVELDVRGQDGTLMTLRTPGNESTRIPLNFPMPNMPPIPPKDVRWMPVKFWQMGLGRDLLDDAGNLWDKLITIHSIPHVEIEKPVRPMVHPALAFGNRQRVGGEIHGVKFNDRNGDGDRDPGEEGLAGWSIVLTSTDAVSLPGRVVRTMADDPTTPENEAGMFWFLDVPAGEYVLHEINQAGWRQTAPREGFYVIDLNEGDEITGRDFGNQKLDTPVRIRLQVSDADGRPVSQTLAGSGDELFLEGYVEDLRDAPRGVFSAYLDVLYDSTLVDVGAPITFGPSYGSGQNGDATIPGLINEVGAFDGEMELGGGEFLLFRVPITALEAGMADFIPNRAEEDLHEVLLYGESGRVPATSIEFVGTTVTIITDTPWQNPITAADVNGDGRCTPLDVLLVINEFNSPRFSGGLGTRFVLPPPDGFPPPFLDVNGNGRLDPLDVLIIVNKLNEMNGVAGAEGELAATFATWFGGNPPAAIETPTPTSPSFAAAAAAIESAVETTASHGPLFLEPAVTRFARSPVAAPAAFSPHRDSAFDFAAFALPPTASRSRTPVVTIAKDDFSDEDWLLGTELRELEGSLSEFANEVAGVFRRT